jgi:plasmid stability protein
VGQLLVRDLDEEVIARLKRRAAANGRSTEAEHRAILEAAVSSSNKDIVAGARQLRQTILDGGPDSVEILRDIRAERAGR